ncbi:hypothetical protein KUTeg_014995 [Tegillarca granosa]|uniref:C-type lectin domain-containing protein n=1 Tax=Tegillarca granosa TaxID=220873 RepID=A0ABQ9ESG5_TEGGR|nr:hypothetical protein KUTeg_014995 [Tegillarca granosa]
MNKTIRLVKGIGFWIGLNDLITDMSFQWIDGSKVTYTNWATREPNNFHNRREDCVMMYIHGGRWNDGICSSTALVNGYVCKRPKQIMSNTPKPESVGCTLPAVGYGASCYYGVAGTTKTWQDAETDCVHRFRGHLATVNDRFTQAFISSYMLYRDDVFWIGLNDQASRGTYKWVSGWPVSFRNEIGTCVAMRNNHPRGLWENHNCTEKHHYWCQYPRPNFSTPPTTALNPNAGQCPSGWTNHLSYCYKSWMEARDYCQSIGANLASIHSQDEDTFISGYVWIDGSATDFTNWNKGEPNNFKDNEDCVEYSMQTSNWNDNNCYLSNSFICKIRKDNTVVDFDYWNPGEPNDAFGGELQPPPKTTAGPGSCPTGQFHHGDFCYYGDTFASKTWPGATYMCQKLGMDLANGFTWSDNSPVNFLNWSPNEPSDPMNSTQEECVQMYRQSGKWNDVNCFSNSGYICKSPVVKPTTVGPKTQSPTTQKPGNPQTPRPQNTQTLATLTQYPTQVPKTTPDPIPVVPNVQSYNGRQTQTQNNMNPNDLSGGAIAAILVAVVFVLVIVGLIVLYIKRRTENGLSGSAGVGGIDNTLYYEKSNEQVNINSSSSEKSGAIGEMDA